MDITFPVSTPSMKMCKDVMDIHQDQSSDDGEHGDQVILLISLNGPAKEGNPAGMSNKKHSFLQTFSIIGKRTIKVNAECGNRPDKSQAKVRRNARLGVSGKGESGRTGPLKGQRKRHENYELLKGVRDLTIDNRPEAAPFNSSQDHSHKKRKRDEEEVPVDKSCSNKGKRVDLARQKATD